MQNISKKPSEIKTIEYKYIAYAIGVQIILI